MAKELEIIVSPFETYDVFDERNLGAQFNFLRIECERIHSILLKEPHGSMLL